MWNRELKEWSRRLEEGETGDPTLELAAELQQNRPPHLELPRDVKVNLRARLLEHYAPVRRTALSVIWSWTLNLAFIAAVVILTVLAFKTLPVKPEVEAGGVTVPTLQPTLKITSSAVIPKPTQTPPVQYMFPTGPYRLAFTSITTKKGPYYLDRLPGYSSIFLSNPTGSQNIRLVKGDYGTLLGLEGVNPKGNFLYYSRYDLSEENPPAGPIPNYFQDLCAIALNGSDPSVIAKYFLPDSGLAFLEDGKRIAYIGQAEEGGTALYVIDTDGDNRIRLVGTEEHPVRIWGATVDGGVIWQEGTLDDHNEISSVGSYWMTRPDGSRKEIVLGDNGKNLDTLSLTFSPDGQRAAYFYPGCVDEAGNEQDCSTLYVKTLDGILQAEHQWESPIYPPAWSPDGKRLLVPEWYQTEDGEGRSYWLWNLDTNQMTKIYGWYVPSSNRSQNFQLNTPQWSPDGQMILGFDISNYPYILDLSSEKIQWTLALEPFIPSLPSWSGPENMMWVP